MKNLLYIVLWTAILMLSGFLCMLLWAVIAHSFGLPVMEYWTAVAVVLLAKLLFYFPEEKKK